MIGQRPTPLPVKPVNSSSRRTSLPRQEFTPPSTRRDVPCQHQATAEYLAARLGKLLRNPSCQVQREAASVLLQELVEAYRLALARQS